MEANSFDHVALWVEDRERLAGFLLERLGLHEITRGEGFTLLGADARQGKLTLFDADGPREPGVLGRVALRVRDLEASRRSLPAGETVISAPGGLEVELVESGDEGPDYDLDHVVLRVPDPDATAAGLAQLGFTRDAQDLHVGNRHVRLEAGPAPDGVRPLLNHLALLVDSAEEMRGEAEARGLEIDKVVDADNTLAVFVRGPDAITVEYVEHKPGFALV
ncbi:MAG: VOC family protein [Thermoleophilaceae bacterium]